MACAHACGPSCQVRAHTFPSKWGTRAARHDAWPPWHAHRMSPSSVSLVCSCALIARNVCSVYCMAASVVPARPVSGRGPSPRLLMKGQVKVCLQPLDMPVWQGSYLNIMTQPCCGWRAAAGLNRPRSPAVYWAGSCRRLQVMGRYKVSARGSTPALHA